MILDCWVSADGKEIISRIFDDESIKFDYSKWYSPEEIGAKCDIALGKIRIFLGSKSKKYRLGNSDKAEEFLTKMNNDFNSRSMVKQ